MAFDCFKKDYSKPSRDYGSHGEGESFKPVWGFINPHTEKAPGASNPRNKVSEYQYGVLMKKHHNFPLEFRDDGLYALTDSIREYKTGLLFGDFKKKYPYEKSTCNGLGSIASNLLSTLVCMMLQNSHYAFCQSEDYMFFLHHFL